MAKQPTYKTVETLNHEDKRKNIPTAEFQSMVDKEQGTPKKIRYPRNTDLDPQLVWRGKDDQEWSDEEEGGEHSNEDEENKSTKKSATDVSRNTTRVEERDWEDIADEDVVKEEEVKEEKTKEEEDIIVKTPAMISDKPNSGGILRPGGGKVR